VDGSNNLDCSTQCGLKIPEFLVYIIVHLEPSFARVFLLSIRWTTDKLWSY